MAILSFRTRQIHRSAQEPGVRKVILDDYAASSDVFGQFVCLFVSRITEYWPNFHGYSTVLEPGGYTHYLSPETDKA